MDRIVGAFIFPEVWQVWTDAQAETVFESLLGFGVNTICTESETYRDDLITLAHRLGLRWFGGIACFSDHVHQHQILRERPEMWPIDESGARRPEMEWYIGLTPTFEDYGESRLALGATPAGRVDLADHALAHKLCGAFLHDADELVTRHAFECMKAVHQRQIGAADPRGQNAHARFLRGPRWQPEVVAQA